jgi:hypothetical protein
LSKLLLNKGIIIKNIEHYKLMNEKRKKISFIAKSESIYAKRKSEKIKKQEHKKQNYLLKTPRVSKYITNIFGIELKGKFCYNKAAPAFRMPEKIYNYD